MNTLKKLKRVASELDKTYMDYLNAQDESIWLLSYPGKLSTLTELASQLYAELEYWCNHYSEICREALLAGMFDVYNDYSNRYDQLDKNIQDFDNSLSIYTKRLLFN